jgi:hypothetical protein
MVSVVLDLRGFNAVFERVVAFVKFRAHSANRFSVGARL